MSRPHGLGRQLEQFYGMDVAADGEYAHFKNGIKVDEQIKRSIAVLAAAGTNQATATALTKDLNAVTAADGTKGVKLPAASIGMSVFVINTGTSVLKVYPATGGTINALSANAAFSLGGERGAWFVASSATQWYAAALDAALPSPTELAYLDGAGTTVVANKAVIADGDKDIVGARQIWLGINGAAGVAGQINLSDGANPGATAAAVYADLLKLIGVTAGTPAAGKVVTTNANNALGAALNLAAGATAAAVALRFGPVATEGLEVQCIDEVVVLTNAVKTNITNTIPIGSVILSVQANLQTAVVGDGTGDDGLVKVGISDDDGDPDKYGKSTVLTQNAKIDTIPDWAVLAGAAQLALYAVDAAGAAVTEKFVGGETVRVRIVFLATNSLVDAA